MGRIGQVFVTHATDPLYTSDAECPFCVAEVFVLLLALLYFFFVDQIGSFAGGAAEVD